MKVDDVQLARECAKGWGKLARDWKRIRWFAVMVPVVACVFAIAFAVIGVTPALALMCVVFVVAALWARKEWRECGAEAAFCQHRANAFARGEWPE